MMPVLLVVAAVVAHSSGAGPTIPDCFAQVVAPTRITLACGDGNFWLGELRWRGWGGATATAAGAAHRNDCTPNCAAGHFHARAVAVAASKPATCPGGRRQYTRLSWRFASRTRSGGTTDFPCSWPLHPGLTAKRSGGTVTLDGTAWTRGGGCPSTVVLTSGTTRIGAAAIRASGTFELHWYAPPGRHVVVARQTCRGRTLYEAVVGVS